MSNAEAIDRVAQVLCEIDTANGPPDWNRLTDFYRDSYRQSARVALKAVAAFDSGHEVIIHAERSPLPDVSERGGTVCVVR